MRFDSSQLSALVESGNASADLSAKIPQLLWLAGEHDDLPAYLVEALPRLVELDEVRYVAVVAPRGGDWSILGSSGRQATLPTELLADALDTEDKANNDEWVVAPLHPRGESGRLLAAHLEADADSTTRAAITAVAPLLGQAALQVLTRHRERRRIRRLEAILEIAGQWNQQHETEPLLKQMAEAATRLLGADRASIFLWDRPNKTLVGRPALGVEGGELRISDDTGVVGKVIQSGDPIRVDLTYGQEQIDRSVEKSLGYETRTLLCVPVRGAAGEIFGAFQVLNKKDGNFTEEDQEALIEMALHAGIALENTQEREGLLKTRRQMSEQAAENVRLVGESPAIEALRSTIERVADTELAVLILGDNGSGKEVVAQSIHYQSDRRDQPFIAVNCAAISETLLESELFGHEKEIGRAHV